MCKQHRHSEQASGYEGPTVRFAEGQLSIEGRAARRCMHSPWHLLWLLWPLSLLGKWMVPAVASLWGVFITDILPWLRMPQIAVAILCIVLGLVLILRPDRSDKHPYD